jgi:hypothetical protein
VYVTKGSEFMIGSLATTVALSAASYTVAQPGAEKPNAEKPKSNADKFIYARQKTGIEKSRDVLAQYTVGLDKAKEGEEVTVRLLNFSDYDNNAKTGIVRPSTKLHVNPPSGLAPVGAKAGSPGTLIQIPPPEGSPPGTPPTTSWVPCVAVGPGEVRAFKPLKDNPDAKSSFPVSVSYQSKQPNGTIRTELMPSGLPGLADVQTAGQPAGGQTLGPGEVRMSQPDAIALYHSYHQRLDEIEGAVDARYGPPPGAKPAK